MATALATSLAQRPAALVSVRGRQRAVSVTARAAKGKTAAQQAYVCVDCGCVFLTRLARFACPAHAHCAYLDLLHLHLQRQARPCSAGVTRPVAAAANTPCHRLLSWIYDGREPFDKLPNSYRCPVCNAPKRRFRATAAKGSNDAAGMRKRYDAMQRGADDGVLDE